jgi:uncharacterized membrane protein (UPF0127 family)
MEWGCGQPPYKWTWGCRIRALKQLRVFNVTRQTTLVTHGQAAESLWTRLVGLLRHAHLESGAGLLLRGEISIHTLGMRFPIDVLFLDRASTVVYLIRAMPPLRASPFIWQARDILELPAGTIDQTHTSVGDTLQIEFVD